MCCSDLAVNLLVVAIHMDFYFIYQHLPCQRKKISNSMSPLLAVVTKGQNRKYLQGALQGLLLVPFYVEH